MRREKFIWVYLTTFWYVYTADWNNSLIVEIYNVNTANSTWLEQNKTIFKNIFNSNENVKIFSVHLPAFFIRPRPPAAAPILENSAETRACVCVCERISFLICLTQVAQVSLRYCSFIQSQLQLLAEHFEERENKTPQGKTMWIPKYPLVKILIGKASKQVHRENFDVLIWVKNVLENSFILLESSRIGGIYIVYLNN